MGCRLSARYVSHACPLSGYLAGRAAAALPALTAGSSRSMSEAVDMHCLVAGRLS